MFNFLPTNILTAAETAHQMKWNKAVSKQHQQQQQQQQQQHKSKATTSNI